MTARLAIGPLQGGGLVLGYRCPSRCRHCLYGCGPHRRDGEGDGAGALDRTLDLLAARAPHAAYHIGGGEPFLDVDRLERAVRGLAARGLALDYVETNAAWVREEAHAVATLDRLAAAGLGCVLVSLSPFHAEFVPPARTLALIRAARRTLAGGALVWLPDFLPEITAGPLEQPLDLEALLAAQGDAWARALVARYHLVPAGRTGRFLHRHGLRRPWRELADDAGCAVRLRDTTHFHVDLDGRYVPGLCAGLALPLAEVPGAITLDRYPVLAALCGGGPAALVELAREHGFHPHATYGSSCDLCAHARFALRRAGFAELGPPGFYDERSVQWADA